MFLEDQLTAWLYQGLLVQKKSAVLGFWSLFAVFLEGEVWFCVCVPTPSGSFFNLKTVTSDKNIRSDSLVGDFLKSGHISTGMHTDNFFWNSIHLDFVVSSVRILAEETSRRRYRIWHKKGKTVILKTRWTKSYTGISQTQHLSHAPFKFAFWGFFRIPQ